MSMRLISPFSRVSVLLAACGVLLSAPRVSLSQGLTEGPDPEVQEELKYAQGLQDLGLPDYAKIVLARITHPAAAAMVKVMRLQVHVSKGDWEAAMAMIAREPDKDGPEAWAMKLTLADGYYAWGIYPKARGIYESLLKQYPEGPPVALKGFYTESLYKYAQMLLLIGDEANAVRIYQKLAKVEMPRHARRQVITETAELMVKLYDKADQKKRESLRKAIETITTEILWVQDIWFGKAIVILAHLNMLDGDVDGAMELIEDYKVQLLNIDKILQEEEERLHEPMTKLSPMAQCRYLLGVMMQEAAQKLMDSNGSPDEIKKLLVGTKRARGGRTSGALQHFVNVFAKYPSTSWAPDAGTRANQVEAILTAPPFNATIKSHIDPEKMKEIERYQFQNARTLYNQNRHKEAAESYVKVLNVFPETESSVAAVGELARCYVEMEEELYADMATRYLAERFSRHAEFANKAGDQVLRVAMMYAERNQPVLRDRVYDSFFQFFPKHPSAPGTLYRMAERKFEQEDYEGALVYFNQVAENHPGLPLWYAAMNRITTCYSHLEQPLKEIKALQAYIKGLEAGERPGQLLISARYREALAYRNLGPKYLVSCYNRLLKLERILRGPDRKAYESNPEQHQVNDEILQGVIYNKAACYALLPPPKGKTETYRKLQALKALEELVETFPTSKFAANALSQVGTIWTVLQKPKQAGDALKRLQKEYPDSPEAKNALFMLGMNLINMGHKEQAVKVFKDMFTSQGQYSDQQILTAGLELQKAGELAIALQAFDRALSTTDIRGVREPGLMGRGSVLVAQGEFTAGAEALEKLLEDYPKSSLTVRATLLLSEAYSQLAKDEADENSRIHIFNKAVTALNKSRRFEKTPAGQARLDLELGRIYQRKAEAEARFGSKERAVEYLGEAISAYQKLILFGNPEEAGVKPHMETAYAEGIPLLLETENWEDAATDAADYLDAFPSGRYVREIRSLRSKARVKLAAQGTVPGTGASESLDDAEPFEELSDAQQGE